MCGHERDFDSRTFTYNNERPDGIPRDFPNRDEIFVLMDVFQGKGGSFQRLIDCGGIRYVLLLDFNKDVENCMENDLLEKMYEGFDLSETDIYGCRQSLTLIAKECMNMVWPYLKEDIQIRRKNDTLMDPIDPLDYDRKDSHKLQLKTIDGSVRVMEHDTHIDNRAEPCDNPSPDLCCFLKKEVEIVETITTCVFRVRIRDEEYALKAGHFDILRGVGKPHAVPSHPNVLSLSGGACRWRGQNYGHVDAVHFGCVTIEP